MDGISKIAIIDRGNGAAAEYDDIMVLYHNDPATFGAPLAEDATTINATASINSVSLVAQALNLTVPSQTFTLPSLAATNWFNFQNRETSQRT